MNKTQLSQAKAGLAAVAIAAAFASPLACAQSSLTTYGILDIQLESRSNMSPDGSRRTALTSGGLNTSRWGLKGSEDLGSGLKAVFQLESEIGVDTGSAGAVMFSRQANVGLEGAWGRLVAGRSFSTAYDFVMPFDPMGYAPFYSWATTANALASGARKDGMVTGVSNLLKYAGSFGGFKVGATLALGEVAEDASAGRYYAVAGAYNNGPFSAALVLEQRNGSTVSGGVYDRENMAHAAASYDFKVAKLFAAQRHYKKRLATGAEPLESSLTWVGVGVPVTDVFSLTAAVYQQDIKSGASGSNDPRLISLRAKYDLSKRTWVYLVLGHAKSKGDGLVSLSREDAGYGNSQQGVGAGIQHRF